MNMPTDPLLETRTTGPAGPGPSRTASPMRRGGSPRPAYDGPERRDHSRTGYTGPERRRTAAPPRLFGLPRWLVISGAAYVAALALALLWIFTY